MIEKTTFSKKELQTELNKKYGIKVEKIEKINKTQYFIIMFYLFFINHYYDYRNYFYLP